MSEIVEVTKEVEINIQIDYIECSECGEELHFKVTSDTHGDLQITVDPCKCGSQED